VVEASGIATLPPARFLELGAQPVSGNVWQNLTIERYRAVAKAPVLPVVMLADVPGEGLAAVREAPDAGVAKHREYALTWFSLAATAAALWIVMNLKRVR
jgi:surfeit locus 1 family protein